MKQKVFLSVAFFLIGICIGGVAECARMSSKAEKDKGRDRKKTVFLNSLDLDIWIIKEGSGL